MSCRSLLLSQVGNCSASRVTSAAMNGFWSPTTMVWETSGLARSRSHVDHVNSEKNAKTTSDTTKNAIIAA